MKRFNRIITTVLAMLMLFTLCFSLVGCGDIRTLELKLTIYDFDDKDWVDRTLEVKLYRHLAPNTVDSIIEKAKAGYYDNTFFYKNESISKQWMFGDLKANDKMDDYLDITQNYTDFIDYKEFANGSTTGSNLKNVKGSVGLWRTWEVKGNYNSSSNALSTGRATWYIPTATNTSYDNWFCVFGEIDLKNNESNIETYNLIDDALESSSHSQRYYIYYTGEYNMDDTVENNGLTFHCDFENEYNEKIKDEDFNDSIFKAEKEQYACYDVQTIQIPVARRGITEDENSALSVKVTGVVVK